MRAIYLFLLFFIFGCFSSNDKNSSEEKNRGIETIEANANKVALIIGNSDYDNDNCDLRNPENDANSIASVLRDNGFKIIQRNNVSQRDFRKAVSDFGNELTEGSVGLFYYAGHGMQVNGTNYLMPTDAQISDQSDVDVYCEDVSKVLEKMKNKKTALNIVVLDACRDNPFSRSWNRSISRGLAGMSAKGSLIIYATGEGETASDGSSSNGLFTQELISCIRNGNNKSVNQIFKQVQLSVANLSNSKQVPALYDNCLYEFYFSGNNNTSNTKINEGNEVVTGIFVDNRDGNKYRWARLGSYIWMCENFRYKADTKCYSYNNNERNVANSGRLYSWSTARSCCPQGWHLPSWEEFGDLMDYFGIVNTSGGSANFIGDTLTKNRNNLIYWLPSNGGYGEYYKNKVEFNSFEYGRYWISEPNRLSHFGLDLSGAGADDTDREGEMQIDFYSVRYVKD